MRSGKSRRRARAVQLQTETNIIRLEQIATRNDSASQDLRGCDGVATNHAHITLMGLSPPRRARPRPLPARAVALPAWPTGNRRIFIQKSVPPSACSNLPRVGLPGTSKFAFRGKKLRLDQFRRHGRANSRWIKGMILRVIFHGLAARDQFFAVPVHEDADTRFARRDALDLRQQSHCLAGNILVSVSPNDDACSRVHLRAEKTDRACFGMLRAAYPRKRLL